MLRFLLLALLLLPTACRAAGLGSPTGGYSVEYAGTTHGFMVLKLAGTIGLSARGYTVHVTFHTAGLAGMLVHADNDSRVSGTFEGGQAHPVLFEGTGHLRGTDRATRIAYRDGNPVVELLRPPVEHERSAVPPEQTRHTMDTLSAIAVLVRRAATDGRCEGAVTTFDGRRLATQAARGAGTEMLPQTGRSLFRGPALRCDFEGRQLGGFVSNENEDDLRRPRHGTAWLAAVLPGAPPVPVQVAFENRLLGQVVLRLTAAAAVP